jgi:cytochrome c556
MKFKTITLATAALCLCFTVVSAKDAVVEKREQMMKGIGGSMGTLSAIAKGTKPFDADAVKTAVSTISANIKAFPDQFPAGSDADSEAAPAIWTNNADFRAHAAKLGSDADMILAAMPTDAAGVAKAAQTLGANCGACHQTYRLKK